MDIEFAEAMADEARAALRRLGKETAEAQRDLEEWKARIRKARELDTGNPSRDCAHEESEPWETEEGWESVVCRPVVRYPLAPRKALRLLEMAGRAAAVGVGVDEMIRIAAIADFSIVTAVIEIAEFVKAHDELMRLMDDSDSSILRRVRRGL